MAKANAEVRYKAEEKRQRTIFIAIILFLIGLVMVFIGTYAYYQTQITGTVSGTVAAWSFKANNSASNFTLNLTPKTEQSTRTLNSTVAPGTSGSFKITLSAVGSALAVNYTITFSGFTNIPTNMKFCSDESCNTVTDITASGYSMTGTLNAGATLDKIIYWQWPANFNDSTSPNVDNPNADKSISFTATVVGQQKP